MRGRHRRPGRPPSPPVRRGDGPPGASRAERTWSAPRQFGRTSTARPAGRAPPGLRGERLPACRTSTAEPGDARCRTYRMRVPHAVRPSRRLGAAQALCSVTNDPHMRRARRWAVRRRARPVHRTRRPPCEGALATSGRSALPGKRCGHAPSPHHPGAQETAGRPRRTPPSRRTSPTPGRAHLTLQPTPVPANTHTPPGAAPGPPCTPIGCGAREWGA